MTKTTFQTRRHDETVTVTGYSLGTYLKKEFACYKQEFGTWHVIELSSGLSTGYRYDTRKTLLENWQNDLNLSLDKAGDNREATLHSLTIGERPVRKARELQASTKLTAIDLPF